MVIVLKQSEELSGRKKQLHKAQKNILMAEFTLQGSSEPILIFISSYLVQVNTKSTQILCWPLIMLKKSIGWIIFSVECFTTVGHDCFRGNLEEWHVLSVEQQGGVAKYAVDLYPGG